MNRYFFIVALLLASFMAYHFSWIRFPSNQEKRVQKQLDEFRELTAAGDSKKIGEGLTRFLDEDAQINLTVHFGPAILQQQTIKIEPQHFTKTSFIRFIDSVLYTLDAYGYQAHIKEFQLNPVNKSVRITFASHEWGNGKSYEGGIGMNLHFASETLCTGMVDISTVLPKLTKADCETQLESFPNK